MQSSPGRIVLSRHANMIGWQPSSPTTRHISLGLHRKPDTVFDKVEVPDLATPMAWICRCCALHSGRTSHAICTVHELPTYWRCCSFQGRSKPTVRTLHASCSHPSLPLLDMGSSCWLRREANERSVCPPTDAGRLHDR